MSSDIRRLIEIKSDVYDLLDIKKRDLRNKGVKRASFDRVIRELLSK